MRDDLPFVGDPVALVRTVPIETLAEAVCSPRHPYAFYDDGRSVFFTCPSCRHADHNSGTAQVLDAWRWKCSKCKAHQTRYRLERFVMEDANALERLYRIVESRRVGA